jgi:hypothetical protein
VGRERTFASIRTIPGKRGWFATISSPVTGEPPASARFRKPAVAKYSSLRRNVIELPTSTTSGTGSRRYRLSVISVPSRVVVAGICSPLPKRMVAKPQAIKTIAAPAPHFANHRTADMFFFAPRIESR